jgi:hypothetical protein
MILRKENIRKKDKNIFVEAGIRTRVIGVSIGRPNLLATELSHRRGQKYV